MAVYTISRSMIKKFKDPADRNKYDLRSHMKTIFTAKGADIKDVCAFFDEEFEKTEEYAAGWRLVGLHAFSEFHQDHVKKWAQYIDPVPPAMTAVVRDIPPYLQVVK